MPKVSDIPKRGKDITVMEPLQSKNQVAKADTIVKVKLVAKMITKGKTRETCLDYIMENFGVGEAQAVNYYQSALHFLTPTEEEKERLIDKNFARLETLYEEAYERHNYKECRELIAEINKMAGITGNKVQIARNKEGEELISISFD